MCGLGGYFLSASREGGPALFEDMLGHLRHRGPDGEGTWESHDGMVGLCHTRLAIVDLSSTANQPIELSDGSLVIVFNGEIYNWQALREELIGFGHHFRTRSDTEVILAGYRQWGDGVLARLRGMFAFAIWNTQSRELFCARDRVGKKPFIYAEGTRGFAFGSEIPAVLAAASAVGADTSRDHSALASMLLHNVRHIPDPATAYRGLRRLRAGHAIIVREGRIAREWRYWHPDAEASRVQKPVTVRQLRQVIEEAVELRRLADVRVGALLSGGVDSTAIVALAQRNSTEPIQTYALGMDREDEDLRRARVMAERLGTRHREFYFDAERQWSIFEQLIATYGDPIMLLPLVHTYELCTAIRDDGIKVVLSGHGADELFYGYTGMLRTATLSSIVRRSERLSPLLSFLPERVLPAPLRVLRARRGARKAALYRGYATDTWPNLVSQDTLPHLRNYAEEELARWGSAAPNADYIDESSFGSLMVENTHSVTTAGDLPAMLAGVEMRAPFLDQEVVALALAADWRQKIPPDGDVHRLKLILKQAVADLMPDDILYASKRGFGMGIQEAQVLSGPWRERAEEAFARSDGLGGLFDAAAIRNMWQQAKKGAPVRWDTVAKLLALEVWSGKEVAP